MFPPVYLQQLAEHAERDGNPPPVRVYCFGGDAVAQASYDLAWRALKPKYLFNGYGPTETVVTPLLWKARAGDACGAAYMPIGTLLGNRSGYILDGQLNLLPVGVAGELYLGGEGVARGYLERPALTAERFVPDPFGAPGSRLYRSGDLTRGRADGVVDYLGRVDHQVKIRGFRIELGEIEARLREHPAVREAVVVAQPGAVGQQLVGYVVAQEPAVADSPEAQAECRAQLKTALRERLPEYMVPSHLLFLARMPLTPNGKLDRRACRSRMRACCSRSTWRREAIWSNRSRGSGRRSCNCNRSGSTTTSSNSAATRCWPPRSLAAYANDCTWRCRSSRCSPRRHWVSSATASRPSRPRARRWKMLWLNPWRRSNVYLPMNLKN